MNFAWIRDVDVNLLKSNGSIHEFLGFIPWWLFSYKGTPHLININANVNLAKYHEMVTLRVPAGVHDEIEFFAWIRKCG